MATVCQSLRRGAYGFAHKRCDHYIMKNPNRKDYSAVSLSSMSAGFLFSDIKNAGLYSAENRVTDGGSPDSYTMVTSVIGEVNNVGIDSDHSGHICSNQEFLPSSKTHDRTVDNDISRYRSIVKFRISHSSRATRRLRNHDKHRLCWFVFTRDYTGNGTRSEPLYKTKTGYYEILEITATATHTQIKTAYYKQSFIYHPDRNAGSEVATVRFSEINEAYTVLANKALRRKYDRGMLAQADLVATASTPGKDTTGGSARQQTESRRSVLAADQRGGVFDFDKFFKAHYSEQLQREKDIRVRKEERLKKEQQRIEDMKLGGMMELCLGLMLVIAVAIVISMKQR